jgi:hypothetical protein
MHMQMSIVKFSAAGGFINYRSALAAAGAAWWLAAGLVLGSLNQPGLLSDLPDSCSGCDNPHPQLRTAVWVLSFVTSGLFVASSISYAVLGQRSGRRRLQEDLNSQGVIVLTEAAAAQADADNAAQCSWQASTPNEHAVQIGPNTTSHIIIRTSKYK